MARSPAKNERITRQRIAFAAVLFVAVSASLVSVFFYAGLQKMSATATYQDSLISNLQANMQRLNSEMQSLEANVSSRDAAIKSLNSQLGLAQGELNSLTPTIKTYYAVAVSTDGSGTVIPVGVKLSQGSGLVSVNIKNVDLLSQAQESIRTASLVAQAETGTSLSSKDIDISFTNNGPDVVTMDGPSAGAVITTLLVAAIENKTINGNILMTGTINPDGSIGQVGGVASKAVAVKDFGASVFLVPAGEKVGVEGLNVTEVASINDALGMVLQ